VSSLSIRRSPCGRERLRIPLNGFQQRNLRPAPESCTDLFSALAALVLLGPRRPGRSKRSKGSVAARSSMRPANLEAPFVQARFRAGRCCGGRQPVAPSMVTSDPDADLRLLRNLALPIKLLEKLRQSRLVLRSHDGPGSRNDTQGLSRRDLLSVDYRNHQIRLPLCNGFGSFRLRLSQSSIGRRFDLMVQRFHPKEKRPLAHPDSVRHQIGRGIERVYGGMTGTRGGLVGRSPVSSANTVFSSAVSPSAPPPTTVIASSGSSFVAGKAARSRMPTKPPPFT
jgi:hypothetical protein